MTACLLGGLPFAATAANSGGTVVQDYSDYHYVGNGSGDVVLESENDTYGGNPVTLYSVSGGRQETGDVENRTIIIGDATHAPNIGEAYGGDTSNGSASYNTLIFQNGTVGGLATSVIVGGFCNGGNVAHNTVTLTGNAKVNRSVQGGLVPNGGVAEYNTVTISGSAEVGGNVWGGSSDSSAAEHNTVTISGGSVKGNVGGGDAYKNATYNTVDISSGEVRGNIYGGWSYLGAATNNTVRLSDTPTLSSATLYGGKCVSGSCIDVITGNTLEILNSGISVAGVENFAALAFILPDTITKGGTMLTTSGSANFPAASTKVDITVTGRPALNVGDTINLISAGILSITLPSTPTIIPAGGYTFEVSKVDPDRLVAKVIPPPPYTITEAFDPAEGTLSCQPNPVTTTGGNTQCNATPEQGYAFDTLTIAPPGNATLGTCDANGCELTGVVGDVTVTGVFKALPPTLQPQQPQQPRQPYVISNTPTMGELGLLLSGLALADAAAPALRRRERKARKQD